MPKSVKDKVMKYTDGLSNTFVEQPICYEIIVLQREVS